MSSIDDAKLRIQVLLILGAVVCPAFLVWIAVESRRQIASSGWPLSYGEVLETEAKPWLDSHNVCKYFGRVSYRYWVDGKEYASDLTDLGEGEKRATREEALGDVSAYRPGMNVDVFYDPVEPTVGVLERGLLPISRAILIGLAIATAICFSGTLLTLRGWFQARRKHRETAHDEVDSDLSAIRRGLDTLSRLDLDIGATIESFRPGTFNVIAGFILSAMLMAAAAAAILFPWYNAYVAHWKLPLNAERGWCWLAVGMATVLGIICAALSLWLAVFARGLLSSFVEVCDDGFRFHSRRPTETVQWQVVTGIREKILHERLPLLKGPANLLLPKVASASYLITTALGKNYPFEGNSIKAIKRFGELLRKTAEERSIPWETIEEH